ncbi:tRNA-dihydrouridine(47) synthase [NAD(P)(+)]-like, partial [Clarias magur]
MNEIQPALTSVLREVQKPVMGTCRAREQEDAVINSFTRWCGRDNLQLNVAKTKKIVEDLPLFRSKTLIPFILGEDMEV